MTNSSETVQEYDYDFYDIFKKTCKYEKGVGNCTKTRESKKCINGKCTQIIIPENKKQVLDDYYKQIHKDVKDVKDVTKYEDIKEYIKQGGGGVPKDKKLYNIVKRDASKKFDSPSGIYRSSWIVKEYKKRGGKYSGIKKKSTGLSRWFNEKWVDIKSPIRNSKGKVISYEKCGSKNSSSKYSLCRPSKRITRKSPKTYKEISKKSLDKAKRDKKSSKNIKFGAGEPENFNQVGNGKIRSQFKGTKSNIMIKVPINVKKTALYAYKLRDMGFKGGIETGWKRAKQLSTKSEIPIEDLRFMKAWFARHIYTSYPTYKKWQEAGRPKTKEWHNKRGIQSWLIWAGDAGFKWVNSDKNIKLLNTTYPDKNYKKLFLK